MLEVEKRDQPIFVYYDILTIVLHKILSVLFILIIPQCTKDTRQGSLGSQIHYLPLHNYFIEYPPPPKNIRNDM